MIDKNKRQCDVLLKMGFTAWIHFRSKLDIARSTKEIKA
mgnify:CR=1 FL=1